MPQRKRENLYGRRSGKALAPYQHDLIGRLLPLLSLDPTAPLDPASLFGSQCSDLWLEIGFGAGEHLLATAEAHRDVGLIGCEPFVNGMARVVAGLAQHDLNNVRLYCGDAGDVIDALPADCLGRVFVFFPDPWPKRRQRKRRFLSDDMLNRLARVMKPGAELRFATDVDDYCGWVLARVLRSPHFGWAAISPRDWREPWPSWITTRYEAKAREAGRRSSYITVLRRRGQGASA